MEEKQRNQGIAMKHFVTFEGIDGSGKSTISKLVYKQLQTQGYDVMYTFEPTDTWIGKCVQRCIETDADPFLTAFTFIADRIDHGKQIQQWLSEDKIVLCDRYAESTYAYQGTQLQGKIEDPIRWLKELSENRILQPERTFLFVIRPQDALARIQDREKLIPFEQVHFLEKVQENYMKLAVGKRFLKIDGMKKKEELVRLCCDDILK
jgi:dTMP kinase